MLARFERGHAHPAVVGNRAVDVHGVDVGVVQDLLIVCISNSNVVFVASLVQALGVAPANGIHFRAGIVLINRDELGAETKANNGYSKRFL